MDKKGSGIFEAVTVSNPSRVEPQTSEEILRWMEEEKMIKRIEDDGYYILNFWALSSAYNLNQFDDLSRKSVRVIKYKGVTKRETEKEQIDVKGYAIGFKRVDSQCIDSSGFYCQRCWPYDRDI